MGKTDTADERWLNHGGLELQPPCRPQRLAELGPLIPTDVSVSGNSWERSSADIAIAGLGWVGIGCNGTARFRVWTHPSVAVTTHDALIPDYAKVFEKPGYSRMLPKPSAKGAGKRVKAGARADE